MLLLLLLLLLGQHVLGVVQVRAQQVLVCQHLICCIDIDTKQRHDVLAITV
jgi:hypothetical protein